MCGPLGILAGGGGAKAAAMSLVSPAAGVAMALSKRKKDRQPALNGKPMALPPQGPGNSSLYNNSPGG